MSENYTEINARTIDQWVADGWIYGTPVDHETCERVRVGEWSVGLTASKPVPKDWFYSLNGARVLGLASGGGQQMPIFALQGADCTVMDYSASQLDSERMVAEREGYKIKIIRGDMTKPLPFPDDYFDMIFNPVSNSYVEDVESVWRECYRVLKRGGLLLAGLDNGINYVFEDDQMTFATKLPYNPLKDKGLYDEAILNGDGIQFSHTIEEQIGGQLRAGFTLLDVYQDTNERGNLHDYNVPTFFATKAIKI